ncbi:MAG: efflux RND transporter permease subunit [Fusobacteriaceae bacterium]
MTLAGLAIKRPVATTMFMISMIFLGFVALFSLKTELLPNMNIPLIMIETTWDGAVPEDIESQITKKIEDVLPNIEGITKVRSSSSFGRSSVIAELDFGSDIDAKKGEIQTEIDAIKAELPGTASEPSIKKLQAGRGVSTMQLILSGPNIPELSTFVEEYVKPRFERIQGVGGLDVSGVAAKQIQVQFDTNKLSGYNLTPTELYGLIQQSSVNLPLGTINTGGKEVVARFVGEFSQIDEFKNMIIKSGGKTLRLIDVAEVVLTTEDVSSLAKRNGEYGIAIGVNKTTSGNTLDINEVVKKNIEELKLYAPSGVSFNIIFDATENIESSINGVKNNGFSGLILATIVLLIFLKNLRATLLITFALPISIMFTFVFLYFQGITLNLISLMGLSIGVGMLTDNSVVVIDNIYRHISELKKTVRDAADDGATEVSIAIIASASTTMVVFIPILFIPGFAREIFRDLAYAIIYSNLAAIIVSLTLMPMVASRFLNPKINVATEGKIFSKFKEKYKKLFDLAFNNKNKTVLVAIVTFFVVITLGIKIVKTEFFPNQDTGKYSIVAELPKGVSIETAEAISEKLEKIAKENEHTKSYTTLLDKQKVIVNIDIGGKSDRKISVFDLQNDMRPIVEKTLDVKSTIANEFQTDTPGKDVQFRVTGDNLDEITQIAIKIKEAITGKKGLVDVSTTAEAGNTEVRIVMDRDKLNSYGITPTELGETISYSLLGGNRGQGKTVTVKTGTEEIDVLIRMSDEDRRKISTLEQINIRTADGNFVKVSDVAKLVMAEGKSEIEKSDKIYYISIDVNDGGVGINNVKNVLVEEFNKVEKSKTVAYQWGGQTELMNDVTVQMGMALLISIFLIYAILASQFENFTLPFIIIGSIPLAMIGVYIGLIVTNKPFNMMVMIGIIMLAGTVVNNAIVLIDYIEILRVRGAEREAAVKEACATRLRPILMTTMTTVLGMVPMALGIGEGAEIYSGMAITVMFGLSFSTLLTLVVIPVLYVLVEDFNNKILSIASKFNSKTS